MEETKKQDEIKQNFKLFHDPRWGSKQLERVSFFKGFSPEELTELYTLGEIKEANPESYIIIEGEATRGLYILLDGTVSVFKNDSTKSKLIRLTYLEKGAIFGELSLFDNAHRSATIAAESFCHLFYLDEKPFNGFLQNKGDSLQVRFFKTCAEDLAQRFRIQNQDYIISQELLWRYALKKPKEIEVKK